MFGSEFGIDLYMCMVLDVYQDLFDEGLFVGKGIYDVEVFEYVFEGCLFENSIFSYDLLEGCYVCVGLVSDVCLYEDYFECYVVDVKCWVCWICGDWQLLFWLLLWILWLVFGWECNWFSLLLCGKLLDNLCWSLVLIVVLVLLVVGWLCVEYLFIWMVWVFVLWFVLLLIGMLCDVLSVFEDMLLEVYYIKVGCGMLQLLLCVFIQVVCFFYEVLLVSGVVLCMFWCMVVICWYLL